MGPVWARHPLTVPGTAAQPAGHCTKGPRSCHRASPGRNQQQSLPSALAPTVSAPCALQGLGRSSRLWQLMGDWANGRLG